MGGNSVRPKCCSCFSSFVIFTDLELESEGTGNRRTSSVRRKISVKLKPTSSKSTRSGRKSKGSKKTTGDRGKNETLPSVQGYVISSKTVKSNAEESKDLYQTLVEKVPNHLGVLTCMACPPGPSSESLNLIRFLSVLVAQV